MPNLQARNLGGVGIIKDLNPWDDPWEAWSGGTNVRFEDGKAMRSPVFRRVVETTGSTLADAASVVSFRPSSGFDNVYLLDSSGRASQFTPGVPGLTDVSGSGFSPIQSSTQFTSCFLGDVFYLNRDTHTPRVILPGSANFAPMANMDSQWTAQILRAFNDFLVAFNVNKAGTQFGTMVKNSDATLAGTVPGTWDITVATGLQGETILAEMDGEIKDANNLRNAMMIYTKSQIWAMEFTGQLTFPFNFAKLWEDPNWGALNRNCAIEVDGLHYVFGSGDIYAHDGSSQPQSIADGKVRKWIYSTMNISKANSFFVCHDPFQNSILFCYVSQDPDVVFTGTDRCNKAAVWNYKSQTWGFQELPNVGGSTVANINTSSSWAADTRTWATSGGTWLDQTDGEKTSLLLAGSASDPLLTASRLYGVDPLFRYSRLGLSMDPEANSPAYLEHGGVNLDREGLPLTTAKLIRSIQPILNILSGPPVKVSMGAAMLLNQLPNYAPAQSFDPTVDYQVQGRASGRYLAVRIDAPTNTEWDCTGFDAMVTTAGNR